MAVWLIDSDILVDIADAIRAKDGTSAAIQVSDLAARIAALPSDAFTILNPVSVIVKNVTIS